MGVPDRREARALGRPEVGPIPPYPYSYTVNGMFTGHSHGPYFDPKTTGEPSARLGRIINPSEKAMMIEEDVKRVNDGMWRPESADYLTWTYSSVSLRHDKDYESDPTGVYFGYMADERGNVVFADGHCEFFRRWDLQYSKYTNPEHRE